MHNIAIIPARSGSKGLKDKNIKPLNGKPLLSYTVQSALESGLFETVMVSTDSESYAEIATRCGAEVPFLRSEDLSSDHASSWDVVREVLSNYQKMGKKYDMVALLQPTSPLRTKEDIIGAYNLLREKNANAVISVCENEVPLEQCNFLPPDRSLVGFYDDRRYHPRQSRQTAYHVNGAVYLYRTEALQNQKTIYDAECYAYIMGRLASVDIDSADDFILCEALLKYFQK